MYSILVVVNKHNTARDASCWFIIYYITKTCILYSVKTKEKNSCKRHLDSFWSHVRNTSINSLISILSIGSNVRLKPVFKCT